MKIFLDSANGFYWSNQMLLYFIPRDGINQTTPTTISGLNKDCWKIVIMWG